MTARPGLLARASGPGTVFVLGLLCLVLAAGAAAGTWWDRQPGSLRPTGDAPITSVEVRDAAVEVAGPLTERVLSYSWQGFDTQVTQTRSLLTPGFAATYDAQVAELREGAVADQVTVEATATDTAIVSASPQQAVALVFVDQVSSTEGAVGQRRDQVRVLVTLRSDGSEWRVARLDSF